MDDSQLSNELHRGLKNRHIQLIAMGGAIGTGLFLSTGATIQQAGPAVVLGYMLGGLIAFLIMRQLGEMIVEEPVSGSFSHFANKYWSPFAGFLAGWNYWILYILVAMTELSAVGKYVHGWNPDIEVWQTMLFFFVMITAINLTAVKFYGESEFWMSLVKVLAVISLIVFGTYLLITAPDDSIHQISNLWMYGGAFPNGFTALILALPIIMFSFGGIELIGMSAAEAQNPEKSLPKAINQVVYRILLFYILALTIIMALIPWNQVKVGNLDQSPFVLVFQEIGIDWAASLFFIVVFTAALSVYNGAMFANSRMLHGLSLQRNAPKSFSKLTKQGVPANAVLFSAALIFLSIPLNYFNPEDALKNLVYIVVGALVFNWAMISITHIKFRQSMKAKQIKTKYPSLLYPFSNILIVLFIIFLLALMYIIGFKATVLMLPIWVMLMYAMYWIMCKARK